MAKGDFVRIFEMSARDGLQNEKRPVATADKIRLIDLLSACGFEKIEATSFVSPKWVPQLADAAAVLAGVHRLPGIAYTALTPNLRGYEGALAAGADEVAIFAAATERFSHANLNCSIAESLERFAAVTEAAERDDMPVRGYVSCAVDCPFEGAVAPSAVAEVSRALFGLGCYEVSLGDTTGQGRPEAVAIMLDAVLGVAPPEKLAGHFHDTAGHALDNIRVALERGLRTFDASVAGLGGCPYAPGAKGNVDTRAAVGLLDRIGYLHGLDEDALAEAARFARSLVTPSVGASE
jgi:hydroxymethylglutaryl-CoA lyase